MHEARSGQPNKALLIYSFPRDFSGRRPQKNKVTKRFKIANHPVEQIRRHRRQINTDGTQIMY